MIHKAAPSPTREQLAQFGRLLRDKRNAAGLSRLQLGRLASLSDATIKFAETAVHTPSRATLIRLIAVPQLKLTWADAPWELNAPLDALLRIEPRTTSAPVCNWFVAPAFDPLEQYNDLRRCLRSTGGYLDQSMAYLDYSSAEDYLAASRVSLVGDALHALTVLAVAAIHIREVCAGNPFSVVTLGPGSGQLEVALVQQLLTIGEIPRHLCLLDLSQPLLARAFRHAGELLTGSHRVPFWALQGNFHELPLYSQLIQTHSPAELCLFCLLGGTFSNLDDERRFLQHSLSPSAQSGDLLLLDVPIARAPFDRPHQIREKDAALSAGVPPTVKQWLGGPLLRHNPELEREIDFRWDLGGQCPIYGSYALDAVATVTNSGRAPRRFSMFRFRRYDVRCLSESLAQLGWDELACIPFGRPSEPAALLLYRRR